jgi:hypothetical protein
MAERFWTCQRTTKGVKCGTRNPKRKHLCEACGKRRPASTKPAHTKVLELPYEAYVIANGGSEDCGICGRPPPEGGKHRRDHEHKGDGLARGLLCWTCNMALRDFATVEWLRAAADYLERADKRRGLNLSALIERK